MLIALFSHSNDISFCLPLFASQKIDVTVGQLENPTKVGFLTKRGGNYRNWKTRYFVLKNDKLYYFVSEDVCQERYFLNDKVKSETEEREKKRDRV
jgi:hypothetical protein